MLNECVFIELLDFLIYVIPFELNIEFANIQFRTDRQRVIRNVFIYLPLG